MSCVRTLFVLVVSVLLCLPAAFGAQETIDFEDLAEGAVVDQVFSREGSGPIGVVGTNKKFPRGRNAALIFDSACPDSGAPADCSGDDPDLGTPNEGFGGPGRGVAGAPEGRYPNSVALGKVLIVAENLDDLDGDGLVDDPDDEGAERLNRLSLDFSEIGTVTVHSLSLVDVNFAGEPSAVDLLDADGNVLGAAPFLLPATDDNGVIVAFDLGDTEGVTEMVVWLRGPGAVDNIVFSPEGPRIDIETLTNGFQADLASDEEIPWIRVGQPVSWTYEVTNVGTVPLSEVVVTDDRGVEVTCPLQELDPGESMECSASGLSLDLEQPDLGTPVVKGQCLSRGGRPLYENTGSVSARGPSGAVATDSDRSHYCADPSRPELFVRKQAKGPDTQSIVGGSDATFKVVLWNRGTEDLRDLKVADVLAPDCNREFGRLAAGKSVSYTCSQPGLSLGGEGVDGCSLVNEVVATGRGDKDVVTDTDTSTVELLGLTIAAGFAGPPAEGGELEIAVTNDGCDLDTVTVTAPEAPECERVLGALAAGDSSSYACSSPAEHEVCAEGKRGETMVTSCVAATFVASPESGSDGPGEDAASGAGDPSGADGTSDGDAGDSTGGGGLLALVLVVLVGGGLFAWNRMRAG